VLKRNRGSAVIEAVLVLPLILILFLITIWGGQLMFTWAGINYAASTAALSAAKTGEVTDNIKNSTLDNLKQWVPGAQDLETDKRNDLGGPPHTKSICIKSIFYNLVQYSLILQGCCSNLIQYTNP
jgi:hypothetical protein